MICESVRISAKHLVEQLRKVVGKRGLLTRAEDTRRFRTGFRCGSGATLAVVQPASLVEMWRTSS